MKPKLVISPTVNARGRYEAESFVTPHKVEGSKRKGRSMKRQPPTVRTPHVTIEQAREALKIDPNAAYSKAHRCLIYKREEN